MDNISHSLISIAVAATISSKSAPKVRKAAIWTAIFAGNLPDNDIVTLEGEYRSSRAQFSALAANCEFRALMIFARIPFIVKDDSIKETIFGDLRFDNEKGLGFSEFTLNSEADCLGLQIPPWIPPRQDIGG